MPTCGDCSLLVKNSSGVYICGGKQNLCFGEQISPEKDAAHCIRFSRKVPKQPEKQQS